MFHTLVFKMKANKSLVSPRMTCFFVLTPYLCGGGKKKENANKALFKYYSYQLYSQHFALETVHNSNPRARAPSLVHNIIYTRGRKASYYCYHVASCKQWMASLHGINTKIFSFNVNFSARQQFSSIHYLLLSLFH